MMRRSAGRRGGNVVCGTNDNAEREKTRHNRFEETRGRESWTIYIVRLDAVADLPICIPLC